MASSARAADGTSTGRLWRFLAAYRSGLQMAGDVISWTLALLLATLLRFDFEVARMGEWPLPTGIVIAGTAQVLVGLSSGLYLGRRRFGSFEEVALLAPVTAVVTVLLLAANLLYGVVLLPRSAALGGALAAFVFMGGIRYTWRLTLEQRRRPDGHHVQRLLVFGAGDGAAQLVTAMLQDPSSPYLPVALLDDDPAKRYLSIKGVRVVGTRAGLEAAAERFQADTLLIALPSADRQLIRELHDRAGACGLQVRIVPSVGELLGGGLSLADIRRVSEADLLGRAQVDLDLPSIASYLAGRRVLVTGAGGSIGSELCRQIAPFAPEQLLVLDHDETALHELQLSMDGRACLDGDDVLLVDIRDRDRVAEVFAAHRPQVVFHAAALKHVPALEAHPGEAVKTNVWGTLNLLEAAAACGVERFVNVSTDKAADPVNVLGLTKRIAEQMTATVADRADGVYLSVRFGNVLGSRGSVLPLFRAQVAAGGPITVTHHDVTRYFMTIEEACQLVVQAGAVGASGEALVLDMGEPVRILDVARRLAATVDPPVDIEFVGLRPGEKLHEELLGADEADHRPRHPLIAHVAVPRTDLGQARELDAAAPRAALAAALRTLCDASPVSRRGR